MTRTLRRPLNAPHRHLVQFCSVRRAPGWCGFALAIAIGATAVPVGAQAVLGYGDDATTAPAGTLRFGFTNLWSRWYEAFDDPAGSGASIKTRSQQRRTLVALDIGITHRLMLTALLPSVGANENATYFPDTARAVHADSLRTFNRSGIGDVAASLKYVWLGAQPERERVSPTGLHVRSALTALGRLGTGGPPRPNSQFGVGTDEGTPGIEVGSFWDVVMGRHFWTSVVGRYEHHLSDTRDIRVGTGTPGDPFDATAAPVATTRKLGDLMSVEVTPRFVLGEYFSIGAQYQYIHERPGTFTGTRDIVESEGGETIHLDASVLDATSQFSEQWVGGGVVFSTVAASREGYGKYPVEIQLRYRRSVSLSGGRPSRGEWGVGLRIYHTLWGKGEAPR